MNKYEGPFLYNRYDRVVFFVVVVISSVATLIPSVMLYHVSFDMAFSFMFASEFLLAILIYFFYLRKIPECKIRIKVDMATARTSALSFLIIIFIQFVVFRYRDYLYHFEPSRINWIAVLVATLVVPYYEEIIYRVCAFGFLCSIFRKNLLIPSLITSVFFCVMHSQYYNILDQAILFVVSMLLLKVRVKSKGVFYPMVIHAGMNFFVIILNIL